MGWSMPISLAGRRVAAVLLLASAIGVMAGGKQKATAGRDEDQPTCKPQGLLILDEPYRRPGNPALDLPFCSEHQRCTCCNASHAIAIQRQLSGLIGDASTTSQCKSISKKMFCRVCDPQVGAGVKTSVCRTTCDSWYSSCQSSFFDFDVSSGLLIPSGEFPQRNLVSAQLTVLVENGTEMCVKSGVQVSDDDESCWNGRLTVPKKGLCERKDHAASRRSKTKAKASSQAGPAEETLNMVWTAMMMGSALAAVVYWYNWRIKDKWAALGRGQKVGSPQHPARRPR